MGTHAPAIGRAMVHPVHVRVAPVLRDRNRLTSAFRLFLALPHILLVGGPIALTLSWSWNENGQQLDWGAGGVLGAVMAVVAIIAWFAILFTGRYPPGLWNLAAFYLRWRVRAVAYMALLRDEYPPFGDGAYPATLTLPHPEDRRDRVSVALRLLLALPQLAVIWLLGVVWGITSVIAWFSILFTGEYPPTLYRFAVGVLQWEIRVEAYVLLLHDAYPPFAIE